MRAATTWAWVPPWLKAVAWGTPSTYVCSSFFIVSSERPQNMHS